MTDVALRGSELVWFQTGDGRLRVEVQLDGADGWLTEAQLSALFEREPADLRSSERGFWRKLRDLYATSVDYDPNAEESQRFFAALQNKMHFAAHGHTAAELIAARADARKPNMGLTSWAGAAPRKADALVAKNYLREDELAALNRIVAACLELVEISVAARHPRSMAEWAAKLDAFLALGERAVLDHEGAVSREEAARTAQEQYERYAHAPTRRHASTRRHAPTRRHASTRRHAHAA